MTETLVRRFEGVAGGAADLAPAWLAALRARGLERFRAMGFPSPRDEEWRFTPLGPLIRTEFGPAPPAPARVEAGALDPFLFGRPEWPRLVLVDGRFAPDLSVLPRGGSVTVQSLGEALDRDGRLLERHLTRHAGVDATPFTALNTAYLEDGAVVQVAPGADVPEPVHLLCVASPAAGGVAMHPRTLILAGDGARAQVVESYVALGRGASYLTNAVTEVIVGANAWLEHCRIQRESEAGFHIAFTQVEQAGDSHYRSFAFAMGGAIARHNLHVRLNAPNGESLLYGLYVGHGEQLIDNHTAIFHDHPDCRSWEVYKGLLDNAAHGVFNGKIFVRPEAQKTDAKQTNRALLLSDAASIDTKPQLEIFADDVKCTHGAAVGQLDEQSFFYLQSRGVPRSTARRLLTYAFAAEVLEEIASTPVREAVDRVVHERLEALA